MHQVGFQPERGLTGTGAADDKHILITGGFGICGPVVHGQTFRLGENDVVGKHRVNVGLDVLRCTPPGGTVFHVFAELLGKTVDEQTGIVTSNTEDLPIYVGFGHIVSKIVNGEKKYKVEFFPKVKFKPFIPDSKTKGDSLEFTTPSVEATIFENDNGDWEKHSVCSTESEANTLLESLFVQSKNLNNEGE